MIIIRRYTSRDWEQVCLLIQTTIRRFLGRHQSKAATKRLVHFFDARNAELRARFNKRPNQVWVGEDNGKIVGMIRGGFEKGIKQLYVKGDYHGQGIGTTLVRTFMDAAKRAGHRTIKVNAAPSAVPFYLRLGFKKSTGIRHDTEDDIHYQPMKKYV